MAEPPGDINMSDVATRAGVSIATVSRALRGLPGVSTATRTRIREIAEELSYVVSPEASGLARGETGRVAVVLPHVGVWFHATMLASVERTLSQAGFDVLIYQVVTKEERTRFFRDLPARRKVDAVIMIALPLLHDEELRLGLLGEHVVVAGGRIREFPRVLVDDRHASFDAVAHLLELGHTKIAMIRTSDTDGVGSTSDIHRRLGYATALASYDLPVRDEYVITLPLTSQAGARGMARLLDLADPPTAVFAYSDEIAVSALAPVIARGLSIPEDISIISVDGNPIAEPFGLTTIDQMVATQGRLAAEMAIGLIRGTMGPREVIVPTLMLTRGSTGPPPSPR